MPSYILKQKRLLFIVFLIVAILIGVKWYFIVILICISLMIIDAEHLYPLAICTSFFGEKKIQFRPFSQFLIVFFFILSCMNALYILDIYPLLGVLFANIFSHLVGCLFVLLSFPSLSNAF